MKPEIERKQLRSFGLIVGGIFALIGLWPILFHRETPRVWALVLGGWLMVQALVLPGTLGPIHRVWMIVGHALGWVNTRILLALAFYGIVAPIGMAARVLGKDPMRRKLDPDADTYRIARASRPGSHMQRQF
jgi:hypothetical protein